MSNLQAAKRATLVSDAPLPPPEVYDEEHTYWPWRHLIAEARNHIVANTPQGGVVLDYMSGTGSLLRGVCEDRPDVMAVGCDIHLPFVEFARKLQPTARFFHADARVFKLDSPVDVITCTAGLHHLNFADQSLFIEKIASECGAGTMVIFGEEAIGDHSTEIERRQSAFKLNGELIAYGIDNQWPETLLEAAIEVLKNDILIRGEFKRDIPSWTRIIEGSFTILETRMTWSPCSGGGDVLFVCRVRESGSGA